MFSKITHGYKIELDCDELGYTLTAFSQGKLIAAITDKDYDNAMFKLDLLILEWNIDAR
jgi:hypothetical protein